MALAIVLTALPALARDRTGPAEVPPADFRGQQYVDSKGCMFMRAGPAGQTIWIPRVTRDGVPLCGNPPSGKRVPVEVEGPPEAAVAEPGNEGASPLTGQDGYLVAVGSFSIAANADKAAARLAALGYPAVIGRLQDASGGLVTVFAGPFETDRRAAKAQAVLQGAGFPDALLLAP